jgi:hypothetical protein
MVIWKLTPVDLDDPNWEASSHRGPVLVRAVNEQKARALAADAFDVKSGFRPGKGVRFPPWTRPALVSAVRAHDTRFDEDGPSEVLEPKV